MRSQINVKFKEIEYFILKYLIIFYPFLISIGKFVPLVDTILTLMMLLILGIDCIMNKKIYFKYIIIFVIFIVSAQMDYNIDRHISHITVLLIFFMAIDSYINGLYKKIYKYIEKYNKFLLLQIFIILILNLVFMFTSLGYSYNYSSDWGVNAFHGIYIDPHQAAYHLCALLVIILLISKNNKKNRMLQYILVFGIEYCILETGARVPTVLGLAIGLIFLIYNRIRITGYSEVANKFFSYLPLIIFGIFTLYFCIYHTSFGTKIINTSKSNSFDNGRSGLREVDINTFKNSDTFHKLFGNGTYNTIKSHETEYSGPIWSHNDLFQILCGMGLIMAIIYCIQWIKVLIVMLKKKKFLGIFVILVCFAVAFYNGLYIHPRFVFAMPLLFLYFLDEEEKCKLR